MQMFDIGDKVVSTEVLEEKFCCDLEKCKGQCCVDGDSGAPLTSEETILLKEIFPKIKKFLKQESLDIIESLGTHVIDDDGDYVTPIIEKRECVYVYFEDGIAKCAIEKAYLKGIIKFKKPLSCHLYPIRIAEYTAFDGVNYHRWPVCKPAIEKGNQLNIPVFKFLKEPLIRKYGKEWYKELSLVNQQLKKGEK